MGDKKITVHRHIVPDGSRVVAQGTFIPVEKYNQAFDDELFTGTHMRTMASKVFEKADKIIMHAYHASIENNADHDCEIYENGPDTCDCGLDDAIHAYREAKENFMRVKRR